VFGVTQIDVYIWFTNYVLWRLLSYGYNHTTWHGSILLVPNLSFWFRYHHFD